MGQGSLTWVDIVLRLGCAVACGGVIGLNRDLHHKGAGLRTFGLVALATAGVAIGALSAGTARPDDFGRLMQGVLTGIGFLGAGVIMRNEASGRVTGLTTAAAIWFVAGLALLCALGQLLLVAILMGIALLLLLVGRRIERWVERLLKSRFGAVDGEDEPAGGAAP